MGAWDVTCACAAGTGTTGTALLGSFPELLLGSSQAAGCRVTPDDGMCAADVVLL